MGEENKKQIFIGSTPIDSVPFSAPPLFVENYATGQDIAWGFQDKKGKSWSTSFEVPFVKHNNVKRLFRQPKFPRKLKKAISKMWTIKRDHNEFGVEFAFNKSITKWQRKARNMIKIENNIIHIPMPNGTMFIIDFNPTFKL